MPLARLRRALTSSSTNSSDSTTSSTTTSSNTSTLDFPINTSTSPREISYFDLPLLSKSPTTRNLSPRDVFPSSPKEAGFPNFTNTTFPSPTATVRPISPSSPSSTTFRKQEIKHKRMSSRTSTLMRMLRRERPHPAERLLKPADPVVVCVLDQWGGFHSSKSSGRRSEDWEGVGPMDDF